MGRGPLTKPLEAVTTDAGCFIQLSHKLSPDGYTQLTNKGKTERLHRTMWKHYHGEIPEGHEIDHLCSNRACFNVDHMQCLDAREHSVKSGFSRWAERRRDAYNLWTAVDGEITGKELADLFGVSRRAGSKWIKRWRNA